MNKVWIIDDDQEMTEAISLMLRLLDCEPTSFYDARSAVDRLAAGNRPDLVLLDINFPEVSGMDLLEYLRRSEKWKDLPVIMLSSETADTIVDEAIAMGANGYIMKPVSLDELQKALTDIQNNNGM